jgi:hypothetical protein
MRGLYLYALVPQGLATPLGSGLTGETLRVQAVGPIAAVFGEVDDPPSIAPASLRLHDEVVRRIAGVSDAILPFRFGATVTSVDELAEGLADRLDALAAAMERTRGCDQMTMRVFGHGSQPAPGPPSDVGPGTRWLRERSTQVAVPEIAVVRAALVALVRAESVEPHGAPPLRASVFHLVERVRLAEYRAAIEALASAVAPSRLALTGPWPPYAFTELE